MIATEDILFIMPRNRELQFPAMAALQFYVNNYQAKMLANTVTPTVPDYRFRYQAEMAEEHWQFFKTIGIELNQDREEIGYPDSVIELSDDKIMSFYGSDKHVGQICAAITGVECPPFPKIKQFEPGLASGYVIGLDQFVLDKRTEIADLIHPRTLMFRTEQDLIEIGVRDTLDIYIGYQSWRTYMLSAMGLPVIEILPRDRGINWLSKFKNSLYRLIEEDRLERLPPALRSIEAVLTFVQEQKKCRSSLSQVGKVDEIATAPTA